MDAYHCQASPQTPSGAVQCAVAMLALALVSEADIAVTDVTAKMRNGELRCNVLLLPCESIDRP